MKLVLLEMLDNHKKSHNTLDTACKYSFICKNSKYLFTTTILYVN